MRRAISAAAAALTLGSATAHAVPLLDGLGGAAGYGTNVLEVGDDNSSTSISVAAAFPRGLNFFGTNFNALFVNNNGNLTFGAAISAYTPEAFPVSARPMIAAFWGDVDTRGTTTADNNRVYWDVRPGQFTATWHNVGYYSSHIDLQNDFQIALIDRSAARVAGDFDVEFRYARCQWTTGDASGGTGGTCPGGASATCTPAQAGFDAGNDRDFSILPGSRTLSVLALCTGSNVGTPGLWRIEVRTGGAVVCGNNIRESGEDCDGMDTPVGRVCTSTCRFGVSNGGACTADAGCVSGHCVDGVCCNTACSGQCEACDLPVARGACLPVVGAPHGARAACSGSGTCGGTCDGALRSTCAYPDNLTPCGDASCADGVISAARMCTGAGACADATTRSCSGYACVGASCLTECATRADCASGFVCTARRCVAATSNGGACMTDAQCTSGHCVDGVCCNTACSGQCEACDAAGSLGTCAGVTGAPHGARAACAGAAGEVCAGRCNGTDRAACSYPDAAVMCREAGCAMGSSTTAATCDGRGACPGASPTACAPYACGGTACATSCATAADCAAGNLCVEGRCVARTPNGAMCNTDGQCASGHCADGVCCDLACNGQCEACDATGMVGTCVAVMGSPHGMRAACSGAGTCGGVCDGTLRATCSYPGSSTSCRAASCREGMGVNPAGCDGAGSCPAESTSTCGAYGCGPDGCRTTCTTDTDCATGSRCNGGRCAPPDATGTTCRRDEDCRSGACAQGVCCDRPCDGVCLACDLAGSVGMCTPRAPGARAGATPDGGVATCATCNGTGACGKSQSDAGVVAMDGGVVISNGTSSCGCTTPGAAHGSPALFGLMLALASARASRRRRR